MAGGIDWFRWHHGTVTDQKFTVVAKRAGATVAEAIAVWACLLEAASTAAVRGCVTSRDFESIDTALGMTDGRAEAIFSAMKAKSLISDDGERVTAWEKRQPKREREDDGASERKRKQRDRDAQEAGNDTPADDVDANVTPCHARSHQKTPRVEESREDIKDPGANAPSSTAPPPTQAANDDDNEQDDAKIDLDGRGVDAKGRPNCPHRKVIALFAERCPMLSQPKPEMWGGARAKHLAARWKWLLTAKRSGDRAGERFATTTEEGLEWLGKFFDRVAASRHLTGGNDRGWEATLEWLVNEENFFKVVQGNYKRESAA